MKHIACTTKSKGELTKEKILAEATRIVNQKGFKATSISDLVKATGLKKGCLYFHFSGKDELLIAILEKAKADFFEVLDSVMTGKTAGDCLNNFFKVVIEFQKSSGFTGGCIFGNTAIEMSDKDKQTTVFVSDFFSEWVEKIRKVVREAQSSGQIRSDISSAVLAKHIIMTIEGGIMLSRLEKNEKPLKDCFASLKALIGLKC